MLVGADLRGRRAGIAPAPRSAAAAASARSTSVVLVVTVDRGDRAARRADRGREGRRAGHARTPLGPGVPRRRRRSSATTIELLPAARRHVRLRDPAVRRQPGARLGYYRQDPRSIPFDDARARHRTELIIGSAGGNEILASLYFKAPQHRSRRAEPGHGVAAHRAIRRLHRPPRRTSPSVHMHQGDGRSYLARSNEKYDLVWYVAPDSYAANNAASSGAFVLSESYLYTTRDDQEDARAPHRRRDHGRAVRRARLRRRAEPDDAATSSPRARRSSSSASRTRPSTCSSSRAHHDGAATSRRSS